MLAAHASGPTNTLILRMAQQSAAILTLTVSAHWFVINEQDPNRKTTLRHRKATLAQNGRLEAAAPFLHDLDLLPATPTIAGAVIP